MIDRRHFLGGSAACAIAGLAPAAAAAAAPPPAPFPPLAPVRPVRDTYFGTSVVDHYRWMEGTPPNAEFARWLDAQGDYARARLDRLPGRARLKEVFQRFVPTVPDAFVVRDWGDTQVIGRVAPGQTSATYHLRRGQREVPLLDPKAADPSDNLDTVSYAPNAALVAYGLSRGGSENSPLMLLDTATGARTLIARQRSRATGWTADGTGLFSYRLRAEARPGAADYRIGGSAWLHRVGSDPASDTIVFGPGEGDVFDPQSSDEPYVTGGPGSAFLMGTHMLNDTLPNQVYVARADAVLAGQRRWRRVVGPDAKAERVELDRDIVYVLARGRNGLGELVAIPAADGTFASGRVLVAGANGTRLRSFAVARDGVYAVLGAPDRDRLMFVPTGGNAREVPAPPGRRLGPPIAHPGANGAWIDTTDWLVPYSTYRYETPDKAPVAAGLVPPPAFPLETIRLLETEVRARDGAMIPVWIFSSATARRDGRNRTLIATYGAYGRNREPSFAPDIASAVDAGLVYVLAGVRGGGEKGDEWHRAGMKQTKPNSWRDAIDVGRWLVAKRWTAPRHLAIQSGSAGGIVVGRAITEAPDLFAAAIGEVGIFDTLRMETTANGPGNVSEFGTVGKEDEFRALLAMDSVQAVRPRVRYPRVLLTTGLNDTRVEPWLPGKFAAKLQATVDGRERTWLKVDRSSGHRSASFDSLRDNFIDSMAFLLWATGGGR